MKTFKTIVYTLIVFFVLAVVAGFGFMYSGTYDVAAVKPHGALTKWALSTTMRRSVVHHARTIQTPPLDVPSKVQVGFGHYHEMCVGCHGAPGVKPGEFSEGLNPHPPDLQKTAGEWTPAQLFWIIKNGVKMTGMAGLAPTHSDQKIWDIVAFIEKMKTMSPDQYQAMVAQSQAGGEQEEHADQGD